MTACNELGDIENDKGNTDMAHYLFMKACFGNDMPGCVNLGYLESKKRGNKNSAEFLYKKACDVGNGEACIFFNSYDEAVKYLTDSTK